MSKYVIDIFSDNPTVTLDYMIAVMQAKRDNPDWVLQAKSARLPNDDWDHAIPLWNWGRVNYRIHPKHRDEYTNKRYAQNPQWLLHTPNGKVFTEESLAGKRVFIRQTGSTKWIEWKPRLSFKIHEAVKTVNPGWELAIAGEDLPMPPTDKELEEHGLEMTWECRSPSYGDKPEVWWYEGIGSPACGFDAEKTLRRWILKHKEKRRVPLTMEDLPPVFWVREKENKAWWSVTFINKNGIFYLRGTDEDLQNCYVPFISMMDCWEYSVDRKEIKPFYKEV